MCGICGIINNQDELKYIFHMNQIQRHRGPDDEGYVFLNSTSGDWIEASGPDTKSGLNYPNNQVVDTNKFDLVLGNRRLSILDLSTAGHMPMSYLDGKLWITHNGEIYNYIELRDILEKKGYDFVSDTDTEVILAAYAEWGYDCLSYFNGMFAFAIWDTLKKKLFCARDRFGIKPFYYFKSGSTFVFASEIKALLRFTKITISPNDQSIYYYLTRGLTDHNDETFFKDIYSIKPSHYLIYDIENQHIKNHQWWKLDINSNLEGDKNKTAQHSIHFRELLEDAVRLRMRSDVPLGSCLSGGLDSSAIVCLANQIVINEGIVPKYLIGEHQKTFTAAYYEPGPDERVYSQKIVQSTGAEENLVFPNGNRLWEEIKSFIWFMDEPVVSTSQYAQWNVMRLASKNNVTVLLDGQGGDELLAGYYNDYYPPYLLQISEKKNLLSSLIAAFQLSYIGGRPVRDTVIRHYSNQLPWPMREIGLAFSSNNFIMGSALQGWQLSNRFLNKFSEIQWRPLTSVSSSGLAGILYDHLMATRLPKLLRYEDRNSMAFSLETRLPFLDYRLVEFVFSLPLDERISHGWNKWILRNSMKNIVPDEILWRKSKLGFATPEDKWMSQGVNNIRQILRTADENLVNPYLSSEVLQNIGNKSSEDLVVTPGLWRIINLILWLNMFFKDIDEQTTGEWRALFT